MLERLVQVLALSFPLIGTLGGSRRWSKDLCPCHHMGNLDGILGSRLQPGPALVGIWENEPVDGGSVYILFK